VVEARRSRLQSGRVIRQNAPVEETGKEEFGLVFFVTYRIELNFIKISALNF
jgi:hypothetical protein